MDFVAQPSLASPTADKEGDIDDKDQRAKGDNFTTREDFSDGPLATLMARGVLGVQLAIYLRPLLVDH